MDAVHSSEVSEVSVINLEDLFIHQYCCEILKYNHDVCYKELSWKDSLSGFIYKFSNLSWKW